MSVPSCILLDSGLIDFPRESAAQKPFPPCTATAAKDTNEPQFYATCSALRATALRMAPVLATATHKFPLNGPQCSLDSASSRIFPALRGNWRPFLCRSRHLLGCCEINAINLGFGRTHTAVPRRHLTTCSLSNYVRNSTERIDSVGWTALMSVQVPLWIGVGPAYGEEILEEIKGGAQEDVLVNGDEGQFITVLLYTAIAGLSLLTIGVIYLAVTEFLEKRERERLLKEEVAKKKKENKTGKVKIAKSGPRGFGQKLQEDD